ncbi:hypothetical protein KCP74_03410 [Salmonella enterica subsp. enterica]|nr:hypothetical protein KCP74_03410 [Salmonella enterica subsp. enterica]
MFARHLLHRLNLSAQCDAAAASPSSSALMPVAREVLLLLTRRHTVACSSPITAAAVTAHCRASSLD